MSARIETLIERPDSFELVRDQIGAILVTELTNQQGFALAAGKEPELWKLRVFLERANPWAEFESAPPQSAGLPIVNVWFDSANYELAGSNVVERQKTSGIYNIDCYGYGVSRNKSDGGHEPGDEKASLECHRAVRLVRNILMAGAYTYLGFPRGGNQIVWRRFPQSLQIFQPRLDDRPVQNVVAARLALQVEFNEFSPQVKGEPLEIIAFQMKRSSTGEVFVSTEYRFEE